MPRASDLEKDELREKHGAIYCIVLDGDEDEVIVRMPKAPELRKALDDGFKTRSFARIFRDCVVYPADKASLEKLCEEEPRLAIQGGANLLAASGALTLAEEIDPDDESISPEMADALVRFADRKNLTIVRHANETTGGTFTLLCRGLREREIAMAEDNVKDLDTMERILKEVCLYPTAADGHLDTAPIKAASPGAFVPIVAVLLKKLANKKALTLGKA